MTVGHHLSCKGKYRLRGREVSGHMRWITEMHPKAKISSEVAELGKTPKN